MNMGRVRSLIIIFLLILNIVLLGFNLERDNRYKITPAQEAAIIEVLKQNNIALYTYMVKEFYPLRQIALKPYDYEPFRMSGLFFDGLPQWVAGPGTDKSVMSQDGKTLTIYHEDRSGFLFENPQGTGKIVLNRESAEKACAAMLERINSRALNLQLDKIIPNAADGYYTVEYRSHYEAQVIYSSVARFRVTENGVVQLRGVFFEPDHFADTVRDIYAADEALYALIRELKNVYGNTVGMIKIDQMDIVYGTEDTAATVQTVISAEPHYRVYISERPDQPFLINAYTNIVR